MEQGFSRRNFLKGSIVVAAGVAGAYGMAGCTPQKKESSETKAAETAPEKAAATAGAVKLVRYYAPAHRDNSFGQAVVALSEDGTIIGASVDEYEFVDASAEGFVGVPNSDAAFAEGYASGKMLISKLDNNDAYSANMKAKNNATQTWGASIDAVTKSVVGKKAEKVSATDAVSGATLVDTAKYVGLIVDAATKGQIIAEGALFDDSAVTIGWVNGKAHGEKAFASAVVVAQSGLIAAASIDEFQFMDASTDGLVPVPNSDAGLAAGYAEGKVLASKSVNSELYSALMKEKAGSTVPWLTSIESTEDSLVGMKADEAEKVTTDTVSGATLVDVAGYAKVAVEALKAAK